MFNLSTQTKIILVGLVLTLLGIIVVAIFITSNQPSSSIPEGEIVVRNGLHWHPRLEISIEGKKQEIPANVGITQVKHEKIHTHEDNKEGILHMEMAGIVTKDETRLGRFFKIWGKTFTSTQIFDKIKGEEGRVKMTVNGRQNSDFENYEMKDNDLIVITYEK